MRGSGRATHRETQDERHIIGTFLAFRCIVVLLLKAGLVSGGKTKSKLKRKYPVVDKQYYHT